MKIAAVLVWIAASCSFLTANAALVRGTNEEAGVVAGLEEEQENRKLTTSCVDSTMRVGDVLNPGESICNSIDGEMVYFGLRVYPNNPRGGYTLYRVELWSDSGTHNRRFSGIGTQGPAPFLKLQGDGNIVFNGGSFSGCQAKPAKRGHGIEARMGGPLPDFLKVFDTDGDLVWSLRQRTLSNGRLYTSGSGCYPDEDAKCLPSLQLDKRLTWNEFVCEYDQDGGVVTRFGLDKSGLLGLWRGSGPLAWRPKNGYWARGDYLHLQDDGHLTLYRDTDPKTYPWVADCYGHDDGSVVVVAGGNVHQLNVDGTVAWALVGDEDPQETCYPGCPA